MPLDGRSASANVIAIRTSMPAVCHGAPLPVPGPMIIRTGTNQAALRRGRMTAIGAIRSVNE